MNIGNFTKINAILIVSSLLLTGGIDIAKANYSHSNIAYTNSNLNSIQRKIVHSMYGDVKLSVSYKRNPTSKETKITGIKTVTNSDPYLKLIDKNWNSSYAIVTYYDSYHEVHVTNTIWASEIK